MLLGLLNLPSEAYLILPTLAQPVISNILILNATAVLRHHKTILMLLTKLIFNCLKESKIKWISKLETQQKQFILECIRMLLSMTCLLFY